MSKLLTLPAQRLAKFWVLGVCLLIVVGIGGPFSGKFEDAQENETESFLPGDAESVAALEQIERFDDGNLAGAVIVIAREDGRLTAEDQRLAQELADDLRNDPPPITRGTEGPIPSEDGQALLVVTQVLDTGGTGEDFLEAVD